MYFTCVKKKKKKEKKRKNKYKHLFISVSCAAHATSLQVVLVAVSLIYPLSELVAFSVCTPKVLILFVLRAAGFCIKAAGPTHSLIAHYVRSSLQVCYCCTVQISSLLPAALLSTVVLF
jgi:hypothetical protein